MSKLFFFHSYGILHGMDSIRCYILFVDMIAPLMGITNQIQYNDWGALKNIFMSFSTHSHLSHSLSSSIPFYPI